MKISRRKFLAAAPAAAGILMQLSGTGLGQSRLFAPVMAGSEGLARLGWSSFYGYVGTTFTFTDSEGRASDLRLTEMTDLRPAGFVSKDPFQERFVMAFAGSSKVQLRQELYSVEHFALGRFDLTITFTGKNKRGSFYEAVINRINS